MTLLECILTNNDCYKTGETLRPVGVMVHSTGADNPWILRYVQPAADDPDRAALLERIGTNRNRNDWNNTTRQVCVHAFVGRLADGTVAAVKTLPWDMRGWHAGRGSEGTANDAYLSFEICEDGLDDAEYFAEVYKVSVQLTAMMCRENGFNPMEPGVVICHSEGYKMGIANNHGDVMHWFPRHGKTMDDFRRDVAGELEREEEEDMDVDRFTELWREMRKGLQDNDANEYSADARQWAVDNGLIVGGSAEEFNGMWEDLLTREQMVTLLYRFAKLVGQA